MNQSELIDQLTEIVIQQAKIIEKQSSSLAQFGAIQELDEEIKTVSEIRAGIIGN